MDVDGNLWWICVDGWMHFVTQFSFNHMTRPKKALRDYTPIETNFWYVHPFIHPSFYLRSRSGTAAPTGNSQTSLSLDLWITLTGGIPRGFLGLFLKVSSRPEHLPRKMPFSHSEKGPEPPELPSMLSSSGSILSLSWMSEVLILLWRETQPPCKVNPPQLLVSVTLFSWTWPKAPDHRWGLEQRLTCSFVLWLRSALLRQRWACPVSPTLPTESNRKWRGERCLRFHAAFWELCAPS